LAFAAESYPVRQAGSYVLLHQTMALEELGHDVHLFNLAKPRVRLADQLEAYDYDLLMLDVEFLRAEDLRRALVRFRRTRAVHAVGMLHAFPAPDAAWDLVDFVVTPWRGPTCEKLARARDLRYLPLGYNARLHRRLPAPPRFGALLAGSAPAAGGSRAHEYLGPLVDDGTVARFGPESPLGPLDPFALASAYASARCLPNVHEPGPAGDCALNERFWQTARCGVPVNDRPPLLEETWEKSLVEIFSCADKVEWQERVRALAAGRVEVDPERIDRLDAALAGHSYHERMRELVGWLV